MIGFKEELKEKLSAVNIALCEYLPAEDNPQGIVYDAMRYSLFAGGKRLRPILMLAAAEMCGKDFDTVKPFACGLEMIHTYSLIHDDLPAMDDDDLRRGIPTNHVKFGEATAILAGDALLNKAFEVMSGADCADAASVLKAISYISSCSGTEGMIGGQIVDIASEGKKITLDELQYIHRLKTGALIRAACVPAAILSGCSQDEIAAVEEFAINLGIAFQIRDDILDVIGDEAQLGKPIGSDAEMDKTTYVTLLGVESSEALVKEYSDKAKAALEIFGDRAEFLNNLTDYLVKRNK